MMRGKRNFHAVVGVALILTTACSSPLLTDRERARLGELALTALPPNPTNAYADDPRAVALGQMFFFDPRFSGPVVVADTSGGTLGQPGDRGRVSCASCHDPREGGADTRSTGPTSLGTGRTTRNTPTVLNAAYHLWQGWAGAFDSLWSMSLGGVEDPSRMNGTRLAVAHLIHDRYRTPFEEIFGPMPALDDRVRFPDEGAPGWPAFDAMTRSDQEAVNRVYVNFGKSVEAYLRRLVDSDSPFDRFLRGDTSAISAAAVRGAKLYVGRAACNECHRGPTGGQDFFANIGVAQIGDAVPRVDRGRADAIPLALANVFNTAGDYSDAPNAAGHLEGLRANPSSLGAFRIPGVRNLGRTAPYMHTGSLETLWDVVDWYRQAAGTDGFVGTRSAAIQPLRLTDEDVADIVAFLLSLDGDALPEALVRPPALP